MTSLLELSVAAQLTECRFLPKPWFFYFRTHLKKKSAYSLWKLFSVKNIRLTCESVNWKYSPIVYYYITMKFADSHVRRQPTYVMGILLQFFFKKAALFLSTHMHFKHHKWGHARANNPVYVV